MTTISQAASVPLLISALGSVHYGDWLVLSAIPSYLSLGDFGIANAAWVPMERSESQGDVAEASSIFRSAWILVSMSCISVGVMATIFNLAFSVNGLFGIEDLRTNQSRLIFELLLVYVLLVLECGLLEIPFRVRGMFPESVYLSAGARLLDLVTLLVAAILTHSIVWATEAYVASRLVGLGIMYTLMRHYTKDYSYGISGTNLRLIRRLAQPGIGYMSLQAGNALTTQGMILTVSKILGPIDVVVLNTVRIASNLIRQCNNVLFHGVQPEVTKLLIAGDRDRARQLLRRSLWMAMAIACTVTAGLLFVGPSIVAAWTHGSVKASHLFTGMMGLTVAADTLWLGLATAIYAANLHLRLGLYFLTSSIVAVVVSAFTLRPIGLVAVPVGLLAIDLIVTPIAIVDSRRAYELVRR